MAEERRRSRPRAERESKSDLEEKVLYINRCSKVVKGGRKFSFSALILVGDGKGRVGVGFAKANEVADAIRKGSESAKKNLFSFELQGDTIPHEVCIKWDGAQVMLKPAKEGTGVIAGSHVRSVLEAGGVKNVVTKSLGCNNAKNQVMAACKALQQLRSRSSALALRGENV